MLAPNQLNIGDTVVVDDNGVRFHGYVDSIKQTSEGVYVEILSPSGPFRLTVAATGWYARTPISRSPMVYRGIAIDTPTRHAFAIMHAFGVVGAAATWPNGGRSRAAREEGATTE